MNFRDGAVAGYKYFDLRETKNIEIHYRGRAKGYFEILADLREKPIAVAEITSGGKAGVATAQIDIPKCSSALYIRFRGAGKLDLLGFTLA